MNVIMVVDGAALARCVADGSLKCGTFDKPEILDSWNRSNVYIAMIASGFYADNSGKEQTAPYKGYPFFNEIKLIVTTFDSNFNQTAFIYNIKNKSAKPRILYKLKECEIYLENNNPPKGIITKYINQVSAVTLGDFSINEIYQSTICFVLINNFNGHIIGYFSWNPSRR